MPTTFATRAEADEYVNRLFAGGRVDDVVIGSGHYIVVFQHGSGVPILGFAEIYREDGRRWRWIAHAPIPRFEFAKAEALDGTIVVTGADSGHRTVIYDPKKG